MLLYRNGSPSAHDHVSRCSSSLIISRRLRASADRRGRFRPVQPRHFTCASHNSDGSTFPVSFCGSQPNNTAHSCQILSAVAAQFTSGGSGDLHATGLRRAVTHGIQFAKRPDVMAGYPHSPSAGAAVCGCLAVPAPLSTRYKVSSRPASTLR